MIDSKPYIKNPISRRTDGSVEMISRAVRGTMENLKLALNMERVDLLSKIEAFNKKAEMLGIEKIPLSSTSVIDDASDINGKAFPHKSDAEEFLKYRGFETLTAYSDIWVRGSVSVMIAYDCENRGANWMFLIK